VEPFVRRVKPLGERIALAQTLLKLTCPGVPDIYQGDELESLTLVDPDNRRPVDWGTRRRALTDPPPKLRVIHEALALRARRPSAFAGGYTPVDAGADVLAFTRDDDVLVAVPLRPDAAYEPPAGWSELCPGLPVWLAESSG
jgi:(1->4)-alpha-D-glucan 1-alpha-D-glucosylmutase